MNQPYVIGIDIGTGSVKAIAMNDRCEVIARAQQFYAPVADVMGSEQDPFEVLETFYKCINGITGLLSYSPEAISISAAMHSIIGTDHSGNPLTKAILWSDTRSSMLAKDLRDSERGKSIYRATGTPVHAMSPLCKIRWLKEHEPITFQSASRFISLKEFIWFHLFGEFKIDYSIASATGLFNIHMLHWDEEALHFSGISSRQLSEPVAPTHSNVLKERKPFISGLDQATVFYTGASDGCLANLGSGALHPSVAVVSMGTSAAVRVTTTHPIADDESIFFNYILDNKRFICGGGINNGGNIIQWLLQSMFAGDAAIKTFEDVFSMIASVQPGSDGLLFLPYLHGERAPVWDEESCGVYFGLRPVHTKAHFARAGAEGICYALHHILSLLEKSSGPVDYIVLSGGLAQHSQMTQMLADITGKKVVLQQDDASITGAAFLALKGLGILKEYATVPVPGGKTTLPIESNRMIYQQYFEIYKKLYPSLKESMHVLHQLTARC